MDDPAVFISVKDLKHLHGGPNAPLLLDLRREPAFQESPAVIAGCLRRRPDRIESWADALPPNRALVVYCVHGQEVSQGAAATLRQRGRETRYLEGGIAAWLEAGGPTADRAEIAALPVQGSLWVTRGRPKIDRIACPWLLLRFVDPAARFLYVPTAKVFGVAEERGAVAYDIPGADFAHVGERCSFDAFVERYDLRDPALIQLAEIVRGADTQRLDLTAQSAGLFSISLGLSAIVADDHEMLDKGLLLYDALYAWCRDCREESHAWPPAMPAGAKGRGGAA
ncbi:MAG: chromate resistance protein ChrB domain-containing protein [Kiloniellales bacterium]